MNSKFFKKIMIFLTILLVIVILLIINIKKNNPGVTEGLGDDVIDLYGKTSNEGVDEQTYFDIKEHIQKYVDYIDINENDENIRQRIYNLLSTNYINKNNITVENLYTNLKVFDQPVVFVPLEISLLQDGNIKSFIVQGLIQSAHNYVLIDEMFVVINIDFKNFTFSIEPIEGDYNSISEIKLEQLEESITVNNDNIFSMSNVLFEDVAEEYVNLYKRLALGSPETFYNFLDEKYRNTKFGTIDEFKKYIEKNKSKIVKSGLSQYRTNVDGNRIRYICVDKNGDNYVINQNGAFNKFTMMLDIYTVDLPEFIEKYDKSANNEKVLLNIKKLTEAIKTEDYSYVYNKLDTTFKSTYFGTLEAFENFVKTKFDVEEDTTKYKSYEEIAGIHVYNIEVTDTSENKIIKAKVVMQLKENRDFVFSFSAEN